MTACAHTPNYPDPLTVPSIQELKSQCQIVDNDEHTAKMRARTTSDGATYLDASYWSKLTEAQRAAVIAHERSHIAIGFEVACEGCADKMAGYYMRAWGYAPGVIRSTFQSLNVGRDLGHGQIADNAAEGASLAQHALASRGLLGSSSSKLDALRSQHIIAQKAGAKAPTKEGSNPATISTATADLTSAGRVDPGGPSTAVPSAPVPIEAVTVDVPGGTLPAPAGASADVANKGTDFAGDAVAAVLGESARPFATKVLIAAGVAATIAVILVFVARKK